LKGENINILDTYRNIHEAYFNLIEELWTDPISPADCDGDAPLPSAPSFGSTDTGSGIGAVSIKPSSGDSSIGRLPGFSVILNTNTNYKRGSDIIFEDFDNTLITTHKPKTSSSYSYSSGYGSGGYQSKQPTYNSSATHYDKGTSSNYNGSGIGSGSGSGLKLGETYRVGDDVMCTKLTDGNTVRYYRAIVKKVYKKTETIGNNDSNSNNVDANGNVGNIFYTCLHKDALQLYNTINAIANNATITTNEEVQHFNSELCEFLPSFLMKMRNSEDVNSATSIEASAKGGLGKVCVYMCPCLCLCVYVYVHVRVLN
jgi:hypothetical protein